MMLPGPMSFPPLPPLPPDCEGMTPDERARAKEWFDYRWQAYQERLERYQEKSKEHERLMDWVFAFFSVMGTLIGTVMVVSVAFAAFVFIVKQAAGE